MFVIPQLRKRSGILIYPCLSFRPSVTSIFGHIFSLAVFAVFGENPKCCFRLGVTVIVDSVVVVVLGVQIL